MQSEIKNRLSSFLKQSKLELSHRRILDEGQLASFEILPCLFHGRESRRVVVALQARGCALFHRPQGGCLHCGLAGDGIVVDDLDTRRQIDRFREKLHRLDFSHCPVLCIYIPGSFLNDKEIDRNTRNQILSIVAAKKGIGKVIFETLPQFVDQEKISDLLTILPDAEIEIMLGLDSRDDLICKLCINKGFTLKSFERACALLKRHGIAFSAFALIKPPFLTEREAIDDTIRTCRYLFDIGAVAVSIEPNTVQDHTVAWKLYKKKLYRPPWLWSIIEVIRNLPPGFEARVGGIVVYPKAVQSAFNCSACSTKVRQKIQDYNLLQDKVIFDKLDCDCKAEWQDELQRPYVSLMARIEKILQEFEV